MLIHLRRARPPWPAEDRLALLQTRYAELAAAARATIAAARAGLPDPLAYLEAELASHGGLPPEDATVLAVLADARTAMALAGQASRPREPMAVAS